MDLFKVSVKMGASWSVQTLRPEGDTQFRAGALLVSRVGQVLERMGEGLARGGWLCDVAGEGEGCKGRIVTPDINTCKVPCHL